MSDEPTRSTRPVIGFITGGNAPPIVPAPTNRGWMSATRRGWANRCLPLRRAELEEFAPELRPIESDEDLRRKDEFFLRSRQEMGQAQAATDAGAGERVPWQGDYTRGSHADGDAGPDDHRTRGDLRPFFQPQQGQTP